MSPRKLLLIGWDAADWDVLHPLLDRGEMPHLQRVVDAGVIGRLTTLDPPISPLLWTSIATGKTADEHRILGFLEPDPATGGARPAHSTSRQAKAIWNILHQNGLRPHAVNWFASFPAEPIRGVCVSNAACQVTADLPAGAIHPPELAATLAQFRVTPQDLRGEDLRLFVPQIETIDQGRDTRILKLAKYLSEGLTAHAMTTWILENQEWDFVALYLDTIDHAGHDFMIFHPPRMPQVHEADFELYQHVITGVYKMHDLMLGRLLDLAGPDITVMIVSDHGFSSGLLRPPEEVLFPGANPIAWHRQHGIICLSGPGIRKDDLLQGAGLLDITPTILALFGLPVGNDMPGRVLKEAFEEPPAEQRIPSWESVPGEAGQHSEEIRQDAWDAEAAMEQLAALGYIEKPSADLAERSKNAADFQRFTLARVLMSKGRAPEAVTLLEELSQQNPDNAHLAFSLGQAYFRSGQYDRSEQLASDLIAKTEMRGMAHILRSNSCIFQGNMEEALRHLMEAEANGRQDPNIFLLIAQAHHRLGRVGDAEVNFRKALELDPRMARSWCGLAVVLLRQKQYREAAEAAMEAVGLGFSQPLAHYILGVALARAGMTDRAVRALDTCIKLQPDYYPAHRWLMEIHTRNSGSADLAAHHRERAETLASAYRAARAMPTPVPSA